MANYKIPVRTAEYAMIGSDYSQQEPKLLAFVISDENMIKAFSEGKDIYATIAGLAFNQPYEKCLEFHPETHEYQPDGKRMRGEAKTIVLGICYGRSTVTIGEQLFGTRDDMSDEDKTKEAQRIYDAVLNAFPNLRTGMMNAQMSARVNGYVETILGRRRHIPDMQLSEFEFRALPGYVNPDIDPLDVNTLQDKNQIPKRVVDQLTQEYSNFKYNGQIYKRNNELYEEHIKVINNRKKITDASRQCLNCVDTETEILTLNGWKKYNEVKEGDKILSYSLSSGMLEEDTIQNVHIYQHDECDIDVIEFKSPTFSSVSTLDHKWITYDGKNRKYEFRKTKEINNHKWPDYPILRSADNCKEDNPNFSDDYLHLVGLLMTDGSFAKGQYGIGFGQTTNRENNLRIYNEMINILTRLGIGYTDYYDDYGYHNMYIKKNDITSDIYYRFFGKLLTEEFIFSLSQRQANVVIDAMLDGDGSISISGVSRNPSRVYGCNSQRKVDLFQLLCIVGGYSTNVLVSYPDDVNNVSSKNKIYPSLHGQRKVIARKPFYNVVIYNVKHAQIYPHHKIYRKIDCVWCVTTGNGTWIARRNNFTYITGNSVIQGSAAELTKMAILRLFDDPRWAELGGRLLIPVHDELICEVPIENWKEAGEVLADVMSAAGSFLPFSISCDVETSLRWYGLEYPCPYIEPESLDNLTEDNIKWIQYHLLENEYTLPVYNDENGDKPRGDAAKGVNGVESEELREVVTDYLHKYQITSDKFIEHIKNKVKSGLIS